MVKRTRKLKKSRVSRKKTYKGGGFLNIFRGKSAKVAPLVNSPPKPIEIPKNVGNARSPVGSLNAEFSNNPGTPSTPTPSRPGSTNGPRRLSLTRSRSPSPSISSPLHASEKLGNRVKGEQVAEMLQPIGRDISLGTVHAPVGNARMAQLSVARSAMNQKKRNNNKPNRRSLTPVNMSKLTGINNGARSAVLNYGI
jgi:hypothetical protein